MAFILVVSVFLCGVALGAGIYLLVRWYGVKRFSESLRASLFLIKVPRILPDQKGSGEAKEFKSEIAHFEELLGGLGAFKKPFSFEIAVPHAGEEISFYLGVPKAMAEVAAKQVQGLWSGATVELLRDDFNIFNVNGAAAAAFLALKEPAALPVRTYLDLGIDSFEPILGTFSKINEIGEGVALQIMLRPAAREVSRSIQRKIEALKKGEPAKHVLGGVFPVSFKDVGEAFNPKTAEEKAKEKSERVVDEEAVKALQAKIAKPLFEVNVRVVASAGSPFQAQDILDGVTAGFGQFGSPTRNTFKVVKPRNQKRIIRDFIFRSFDTGEIMVLSSEEIASFYHLPISTTEAPRVKWLKSREAPPPENLPKSGTLLGDAVFRGTAKPVYMSEDDRRRHLYIVGQTGTGKSTLIGNLAVEDILAGKGLAIIDPHGDLVENALGFVPKERLDDIIYFDAGDLARPMGMNMLDYHPDRPEEKTFIVNEMINIFDKLYDLKTTGGPMFEQYMRNALLLMMEDMPNEPATLIEVPRIFSDAAYRNRKLARVRNPVVVDFWEKEATKAGGEASLANMTPYITSKFTSFISNDYMRPIVGQPKSAFNFREAMDSGKILLVNLSKGRIGDLNAQLLGLIITGKLLMAALSRADTPGGDRRDFYLYIDEFQNFATDSISTILSEARKYRLDLILAHQFIAQLTDKIRDSVFGNVGSMLSFRVGPQDAEFLEKQFEPVVNRQDLVNVDNFKAYTRLLIGGQTSRAFLLKIGTTSWGGGDRELGEKMKEYSRMKYGEDRQIVEEAIYRRLRE
jgi:DNA helicase HerA-like ATPase